MNYTTVALDESHKEVICSDAQLSVNVDPTIVRVRGLIQAALIPDGYGGNAVIRVAVGLIIADENLIGVGDIWGQLVSEKDFLWYHSFFLSTTARIRPYWNGSARVDATVWENDPYGKKEVMVDTKAMRKVPRGSELVLASTVDNIVGSNNQANIQAKLRTLIKE